MKHYLTGRSVKLRSLEDVIRHEFYDEQGTSDAEVGQSVSFYVSFQCSRVHLLDYRVLVELEQPKAIAELDGSLASRADGLLGTPRAFFGLA